METTIEKHRDLINQLGGAWVAEDGQIFPPTEIGKTNAFSYSARRSPKIKIEFVPATNPEPIKNELKKKTKNGTQ